MELLGKCPLITVGFGVSLKCVALIFYFSNILKYCLAEKSDSFISETKKMDFEKKLQ